MDFRVFFLVLVKKFFTSRKQLEFCRWGLQLQRKNFSISIYSVHELQKRNVYSFSLNVYLIVNSLNFLFSLLTYRYDQLF